MKSRQLRCSTAANSYTGATIVHGGTLLVNGSISGSMATDVRSGATLGGRGSVGNVKVAASGRLAPGDALGHASILNTKDLMFADGTSKLTIEIGGLTAGGDGVTGYDRVNVTGVVSLNGAQFDGSLLNGFKPALGDLFFVIINDGTDDVQGTFDQFGQGSRLSIGGEQFEISYTGNYTGNSATDSFTNGNDVVLRAIPEPSACVLMLGGALLAGGFRRRRR